MSKKCFLLLLLPAILIIPGIINSQSTLELKPYNLVVQGWAPLAILRNPEQVDILIVREKNGEDSVYTLFQDVKATKAKQNGQDSTITLLLPQRTITELNTLQATLNKKTDAFVMIVRNNKDDKVFPLETSTISRLFQ